MAVTNSEHHLRELRELAGGAAWGRVFTRENGAELLERHFTSVERRDADGWITIEDDETIRGFVDSLDAERADRAARVRAAAPQPPRDLDLRRDAMIHPAELIERKRNGEELSDEEISELILGYARGEVPDYQLAAFCMAVYFRGLNPAETYALTDAMIRSGKTLDLSEALGRKVVDKHSTGGVGDKTSIAVGPIVAACGVPVGKMSGRGLGHTGGTLDKLEAIPGFGVESLDRASSSSRSATSGSRSSARPRTSSRPTSSSTACAT